MFQSSGHRSPWNTDSDSNVSDSDNQFSDDIESPMPSAAPTANDPEPEVEPEISEIGGVHGITVAIGNVNLNVNLNVELPAVPLPSRVSFLEPPRVSSAPMSEDIRHYVVWRVDGRSELRGLWTGVFPAVWTALQRELPQQRYSPGTSALRRATSMDAAFTMWHDEAIKHKCPRGEPRVFYVDATGTRFP